MSRCWSEAPGARPDIGEVSRDVDAFFRECQDEGALLKGNDDGRREPNVNVADRDNRSFIVRAISRLFGQVSRLVT
jgi:hypothetical protein